MKNYLVGWRKWETEFNGDKVEMEIKALNRSEFLSLLPIMDEYSAMANKEEKNQAADIGKILDSLAPIITPKVRNLSGFLIDSEPPSAAILFEHADFMPLVMDITFKIINISQLGKEEEKNYEGRSPKEA